MARQGYQYLLDKASDAAHYAGRKALDSATLDELRGVAAYLGEGSQDEAFLVEIVRAEIEHREQS